MIRHSSVFSGETSNVTNIPLFMNGECSLLALLAAPAAQHMHSKDTSWTTCSLVMPSGSVNYLYVDSCLQSVSSEKDAKALVDQLQTLLAQGGLELRQWASNCPDTIFHLPAETRSDSVKKWISQGQPDQQESALVLQCHCQTDTMSYKS